MLQEAKSYPNQVAPYEANSNDIDGIVNKYLPDTGIWRTQGFQDTDHICLFKNEDQ
jgi:hypothetical protein